jgi:hypothetical protein
VEGKLFKKPTKRRRKKSTDFDKNKDVLQFGTED